MKVRTKKKYDYINLTPDTTYDVVGTELVDGRVAAYAVIGDNGKQSLIYTAYVDVVSEPGMLETYQTVTYKGVDDYKNLTFGKDYTLLGGTQHTYIVLDDAGEKMAYPKQMFYPPVPLKHPAPETPKPGTQYICPMDLYGGFIKRGDIITICTNKLMYQSLNSDNKNLHGKMDISHLLLPAEIVETWKKVELDIHVNGSKVLFRDNMAYVYGGWFDIKHLEILRDIPRETYDKIIERLSDVKTKDQ